MSVSPQNSPVNSLHRVRSGSSDGEHETRSPISNCSETDQRPERMRDWLIRMINSGRFTGLDWLDEDKTVFKVPWIHAKKRGYNRERDAALFREWAMHSGQYRQDSDPTVWKINFRCAINGLKDIMEIKDMQTEDCRVYKVLPSRSKRRRPKVARQRAEPYPTSYATGAEGMLAYSQGLSGYHHHMMSQHHNPYTTATPPVTGAESSLYTPPFTPIKMEYPCGPGSVSSCMQMPSSSYLVPLPPPPASLSMPTTCTGHIVEPSTAYSSSISSTGRSLQDRHMSESNYYDSSIREAPAAHHQQQQPSSASISTIHHTQSTSEVLALTRQDSPDSGFGNGEPQNSPLNPQNSPLVAQQQSPPAVISQQNSPIMAQQHSPMMAQQHSPMMAQQHSPIMAQQHSPLMAQQNSPLGSESQQPLQSLQSAISTCSLNASSPSSVSSPTCTSPAAMPTVDDTKVVDILSDLVDHPPTPPMSATPPSSQLQIRIFYGSIPVHTEYLDCKNGCRIFSSEESLPPSASWQEDEKMIRFFGPPEAKNIVLPDNHPQSCARDIFNAMRRGVLIEASDGNVYVTPLCRTVVYCGSSSTDLAQPLEKEVRSKVFDYRGHFRPALEHYALVHSQSPTPYTILGLGQNWGRGRHVTQNLISIVITHAQARHEIDAIGLTHAVTQDLLIDLPDSVMIDQPNSFDMEAEAFLNDHGIQV